MTNPTLVTTPFAENGDKNTIPESVGAEPQNATMQAGFPPITQQKISEGGIPPERNDFNGILNLYGQHIVHLNKGLPYEFDQAFADAIGGYPLNSRLMLDNGNIVRSTVVNNTINPNGNMTGWIFESSNIDLEMFGADPTGATPSDSAIIAALAYSAATKTKITQNSGTFFVNSSSTFQIKHDYDFSGCVFKIGPMFNGQFEISRNTVVTEYDESSPIVSLLKTGGTLPKGAVKIGVIENDTTLDDSYVAIYASQVMYYYRGDAQSRFELDRFYKRGQIESGFIYDFDLSKINKIRAQKVESSFLNGTGLTIDETFLSVDKTLVAIRSGNCYNLEKFRFIDNSTSTGTPLKNRIGIYPDAHNVIIDGVKTSSVYINQDSEANYTIFAGENYGLSFKNIEADGAGWGAFGMNNCKNVSIEKSQVNRIDFHKPCHNYLKIDNNIIGNWGVLVTMMGDLIVTNNKFLQRDGYNNSGIIRTRTDTGGFCNGDLVWKNNTIEGRSPNSRISLIDCQGSYAETTESPVRAECFTNVYIDGIHQKGVNTWFNRLFSIPDTMTSVTNKLPKKIVVNDLNLESSTQPLNINVSFFAKRNEGVYLQYSNSNIDQISITDANNVGTYIDATISNVKGLIPNNGFTLINTANMDVKVLNGSTIKKYTEFSGAWTTFTPTIRLYNGRLRNSDDTIYIDAQNPSKDRIIALGFDFNYGNQAQFLGDFKFFTPKSCTFANSREIRLFDSSGTTFNFTIDAYGSIQLLVRTGNSASNDYIEEVVNVLLSSNGTYNLQAGTIVVSVSGSTATVTVNSTALRVVAITS